MPASPSVDADAVRTIATRRRSPLQFFLSVFALSSGITFASYYDPRITGLIVAFAAAIVAVVWGHER